MTVGLGLRDTADVSRNADLSPRRSATRVAAAIGWCALVLAAGPAASSEASGGREHQPLGGTEPPNDEGRLHATVVDVLMNGSSWLLVDIIDGAVQGLTRVVVEVEGSRVACNGVSGPTHLLSDGEEVSFVVVPGAATRPDPPDLRWTASVAVVGGDVQMACASDAELTGTLAAQRDRWEAAGIDDYEFTLHWEEFSYWAAATECR